MIVAFTKDWNDVPTCTTHILRAMAKNTPVIWVSSIGTRKPSLGSSRDLRRIASRIASGIKPAETKENMLRVLKPLLIPKAETQIARSINQIIFSRYVRREVRRSPQPNSAGTDMMEYWCFVPNAVDLIPRSAYSNPRCRIIYYCADDWTKFHNLDGAWMERKESELIACSDAVFVTSEYLREKLSYANNRLFYMPHGVDYERFSLALDKSVPVPADMRPIPKPLIGFYGNLHPWIDFKLIEKLAQARPRWQFVLIGEKYVSTPDLNCLANVYFPGRREHAELHNYCRAFDVGFIPYDMSDPRMQSVNPVKTKEMLAAGLPVVAADVPELRNYGDDVITCSGLQQWLAAFERQLARKDQAAISARVKNEAWSNKVRQIRAVVDKIVRGTSGQS